MNTTLPKYLTIKDDTHFDMLPGYQRATLAASASMPAAASGVTTYVRQDLAAGDTQAAASTGAQVAVAKVTEAHPTTAEVASAAEKGDVTALTKILSEKNKKLHQLETEAASAATEKANAVKRADAEGYARGHKEAKDAAAAGVVNPAGPAAAAPSNASLTATKA